YTSEKPIRTPGDLAGVKIRVMNSRTAMEMIRVLGGSPTPIAWEELYTALQQGTVDGAENNLPSFYSSRHFEICRYFTLDAHTRIPDIVMLSEWTWERLTAQQRAWVTAAARDASAFQRAVWDEATRNAYISAKEAGVEFIEPDKAAFVAAVQPMLARYENGPAGEFLRRIRELGEP
ncbi:MAG: TRAP transporter substrate-binding protein, partial [Verrucomicrobia bacterium]